MQAMRFSSTVPIVRVAWNDMVLIKRALDIGANGIIVPWVNTKEEAERAVQAIKYPTEGSEGFRTEEGLSRRSQTTLRPLDDELILGVQIETRKAIDNLDEIFSVKGIDAVVIGPADLSLSLGMLMQYDNPKFNAALDKVAAAAKKHKVAAGFLAVGRRREACEAGLQLAKRAGGPQLPQERRTNRRWTTPERP